MATARLARDTHQCPDHFTFERKHPGLIAAWALGLLLLVLVLSAIR